MFRNLGLLLALLVPCVGSVAIAEEAVVDPRVAQAKTACAAGDPQTAVRLLAELYTETNDPIWVFNQGRCYHQNGLFSPALARFKEFLRKSGGGPAEDVRDAQGYIDEIEAELRRTETRPVVASAPPPPIPVQQDVTQTVPVPTAHPGRGLRYAGIGCGILAGAAVVSGVAFSMLVNQTNHDVEEQTKDDVVPASAVSGDLDDGARYESLQWVSYGVGAASAIAGAFLYYYGYKAARTTDSSSTAQLSPLLVTRGAGAALQLSF